MAPDNEQQIAENRHTDGQIWTSMREGFQDMRTMLQGLDSRLRNVEVQVANLIGNQTNRIEILELSNKDQNKKIDEIEHWVEEMKPVIKVCIWVGITLGGLILVLMFKILTHQVVLGFN